MDESLWGNVQTRVLYAKACTYQVKEKVPGVPHSFLLAHANAVLCLHAFIGHNTFFTSQ